MMRRVLPLALLLSVLAGMPALAHAMLESEAPSAGAVLGTAPPSVFLSFSEALEPAMSGITVTDASGRSFAARPVHVKGRVMLLALPQLAPGKYHVAWHAVALDTHRSEGGYDFTVKP